jgi:hypothetical protein
MPLHKSTADCPFFDKTQDPDICLGIFHHSAWAPNHNNRKPRTYTLSRGKLKGTYKLSDSWAPADSPELMDKERTFSAAVSLYSCGFEFTPENEITFQHFKTIKPDEFEVELLKL